eukprot:tig00000743_g3862.t1
MKPAERPAPPPLTGECALMFAPTIAASAAVGGSRRFFGRVPPSSNSRRRAPPRRRHAPARLVASAVKEPRPSTGAPGSTSSSSSSIVGTPATTRTDPDGAGSEVQLQRSASRLRELDHEFSFSRQMPKLLWRSAEIGTAFGGLLLRVLWDLQRGRRGPEMQRLRGKDFAMTLAKLGPTFVKVGQALSTRPDLLPPPVLYEMASLQDRLPPYPNDLAFALIEAELGVPHTEIYSSIGPDPVAAASLGQVYKGTLRATGEEVAIKLQRPDVRERIALDIFVAKGVARGLAALIKAVRRDLDLDLEVIVAEFEQQLFNELDYELEGKNADKFNELYGGLPNIHVPKIYWEHTKKRVLTMEWVEGTKLTALDEIAAQGLEIRPVIEALIQCSIRQLLENGFFHADPHPGNLLAMRDGKLAFLDFGMVSYVEPYQRYGLLEAITHLVNRDFEKMGKLYKRLGFLDDEVDTSPITQAMRRTLPDVLGQNVGTLNFKTVIDELGEIMFRFSFHVPPFYASIIRCLGVLEGLALSADPDFKILGSAYPYIARRLLSDPELRGCLRGLVFDERNQRVRWGRLEQLLSEASSTPDFDVSTVVNDAASLFLSSEGADARHVVATEVTDLIDRFALDSLVVAEHVARDPVRVAYAAANALSARLEADGGLELGRDLEAVREAFMAEVARGTSIEMEEREAAAAAAREREAGRALGTGEAHTRTAVQSAAALARAFLQPNVNEGGGAGGRGGGGEDLGPPETAGERYGSVRRLLARAAAAGAGGGSGEAVAALSALSGADGAREAGVDVTLRVAAGLADRWAARALRRLLLGSPAPEAAREQA